MLTATAFARTGIQPAELVEFGSMVVLSTVLSQAPRLSARFSVAPFAVRAQSPRREGHADLLISGPQFAKPLASTRLARHRIALVCD